MLVRDTRMSRQTHILKLTKHDEQREIDFELDWLATLTVAERFELMFAKSREMRLMLEQHGHREPDTIIRRT